ncbi:MAG TPA: hypothetical protein VL358_06925 [Caulobacteraceae bacterium]|jgi:hypothetical protein|nr:hypothetical protein [Caulobacteraceae bacterium]
MPYRITYTSPDGATRITCADPAEALRAAEAAIAEGRGDVWIADDEQHLFSVGEFARFINGAK